MPLITGICLLKTILFLMYVFHTAFRNTLKLMFCSFYIKKGNLLTAWSFASMSPFFYSGFKAFTIYLYLCIKFAYVIHKYIAQLLALSPLIRAILHVLSVMVLRIKIYGCEFHLAICINYSCCRLQCKVVTVTSMIMN